MATVDLSWTDNSGNEDGFTVYRSTTTSPTFPNDYSEIATVSANTTTFSDTDAPSGVVYYAVTAYNAAGESSATTTSIDVTVTVSRTVSVTATTTPAMEATTTTNADISIAARGDPSAQRTTTDTRQISPTATATPRVAQTAVATPTIDLSPSATPRAETTAVTDANVSVEPTATVSTQATATTARDVSVEAAAAPRTSRTTGATPTIDVAPSVTPALSLGEITASTSVSADPTATVGVDADVFASASIQPSVAADVQASATTAVSSPGVALSWDAPDSDQIDGYRIYRSETVGVTAAESNQIGEVDASQTSYDDYSIPDSGTLHYVVTAFNAGGESDPSTEASVDVSDQVGPSVSVSASADPSASIPTKLPISTISPPDDLAATADGLTAVDLSWTDSASGEDGYFVARQRYVDGEWWPEIEIAELLADAAGYTDSSVQPGQEWRYLVQPFVDLGNGLIGVADSNQATATTESSGLDTDQAPAQGWRVEIDSGSTTRSPAISSTRLQPTVNGTPSMQLDLPRDETWQQDQYDDADVRVWRDGVKQPLDDLDSRELTSGGTSMTLSGGSQLGQRVVARSDDIERVGDFVERLISDYTSYTPVVDDPNPDIIADEQLRVADDLAELQAAFVDIPSDVPLKWDDGDLVPTQTAFISVATGGEEDTRYTEGSADRLTSYAQFGYELSFTCEHDIENPVVYVRSEEQQEQDITSTEILVDGAIESSFSPPETLGWESSSVSSIPAGSHTIRVRPFSQESFYFEDIDDDGTDEKVKSYGDVDIDVLAIVDGRYYDGNFDNIVHEDNGDLDDPSLYPDTSPAKLALEVVNTPFIADSATLAATQADGSVVDSLGIQDTSDSYVTEKDVSSTTLTYSDLTTAVKGRVGLGKQTDLSAQDKTPRFGYEPQRLDSIELTADLDTTPVLVNRTFDEPLVDILREAMATYDGAFEVREGDPTELHVSRIDGRPVDIDPDLSDTSVERDTSGAVDIAIVYAAAESITELPFSATQDQWEQLPLDDGRIVEQSETVRDGPSGTPLDRGDDYEIREVVEGGPPEIKLLTSVSDPHIDCQFKPRGYYEADSVPQYPDEIVRDAPELNSKQMADLAAYQAVEGAYTDATIDATVELPPGEIGFDVIDALNVADLPGDDPYQVRDVEVSPQRIRVRLGAGTTASEAIQEIRDRTRRVSERV